MKVNVCENCTFQAIRTKNASGKRRLNSINRAAMSVLHAKNDATKLFHLLDEFTENNEALVFF